MPASAETKHQRLEAIRELLTTQPVRSQSALVVRLREQGFPVTQSSVSRDLRELRAAKVDGRYRVETGETHLAAPAVPLVPLLGWEWAGPNLVVLRTVEGGASRVGLRIDRGEWPEVAGTVAGDDTVFVAVRERADPRSLESRLQALWARGTQHV